ncbi:MAG: Tagatose 1,6-diphosphate aldolase [Phycisphaerae bacterium]|nr:Tagatose 1,6-diphosphate aldolase [Phycisphaerae bacterium]
MVTMSAAKLQRMKNLSNTHGVIAAAAMDQRGSLKKAIAKDKGVDPKLITDEMMNEFKVAVSQALTPHASAILLDPQWGIPAMKARHKSCGLLVSYEESGYDQSGAGRIPLLLKDWNVARIMEIGADAIKILMYYTPFDAPEINKKKHDWARKIGEECAKHEMPYFLEIVAYEENEKGEKSLEFAKKKPAAVEGYMREFSKPEYHVDVLKAEIPIDVAYLQGSKANKTGEVAYTKTQALDIFRKVAAVTRLPFIYLSAGVDDDVFRESLLLAHEAGVKFNGVLCGRATWKEGMPIYAKQGLKALQDWLNDRGVKNIQALNQVLEKAATPWWDVYGGLNKITVRN